MPGLARRPPRSSQWWRKSGRATSHHQSAYPICHGSKSMVLYATNRSPPHCEVPFQQLKVQSQGLLHRPCWVAWQAHHCIKKILMITTTQRRLQMISSRRKMLRPMQRSWPKIPPRPSSILTSPSCPPQVKRVASTTPGQTVVEECPLGGLKAIQGKGHGPLSHGHQC